MRITRNTLTDGGCVEIREKPILNGAPKVNTIYRYEPNNIVKSPEKKTEIFGYNLNVFEGKKVLVENKSDLFNEVTHNPWAYDSKENYGTTTEKSAETTKVNFETNDWTYRDDEYTFNGSYPYRYEYYNFDVSSNKWYQSTYQ